jgi:hypothetical protein
MIVFSPDGLHAGTPAAPDPPSWRKTQKNRTLPCESATRAHGIGKDPLLCSAVGLELKCKRSSAKSTSL